MANFKKKFDWDHARKLRALGLTYKAIGDTLGTESSYVYTVLTGYRAPSKKPKGDPTAPPANKVPDATRILIRLQYKKGYTRRQIADTLGLCVRTVGRIINEV